MASPDPGPIACQTRRASEAPCADGIPIAWPSASAIACRLARPAIYLDAASTVLSMVRQSLFSGAIAVLANLVFAQGYFLQGTPPARQSNATFVASTMSYVSFFLAISMLGGYTATMSRHRHFQSPNKPPSTLFWTWRLVVVSWYHYVLSLVTVALLTSWLAQYDSIRPFKAHFYAGALAINYYTAALDVCSRRLYQTETVEGRAQGYSNRAAMWKRLLIAYKRDFGFVVAVFVASAYVHVASRVQLGTQEALLLFTGVSMAFRIVVLKITRHFILRLHKVHIRTLYLVTAVPTVLINTQVRVALLRAQGSVSVNTMVLLALVEPVMRSLKVWGVRSDVQRLTKPHGSPHVLQSTRVVQVAPNEQRSSFTRPAFGVIPASSSAVLTNTKDVAVLASPRHVPPSTRSLEESQRWVQRILRFAAAEAHADMCSEYIAIACSTAMYYTFQHHPKFSWDSLAPPPAVASIASVKPHPDEDAAIGTVASLTTTLTLLVLQLVIEIGIDFVCCLWELANEIPLRAASGINAYLAALFTGCAINNVAVCCALYVKNDH